jgi:hypothetical protein
MAFTSDLTIGTTVYSQTASYPTSTLRSDSAAGVNAQSNMTISHETLKSGRVSSAVILDDELLPVTDEVCSKPSLIRAMLKLQYHPYDGRTDTSAVVKELVASLVAFATEANITKLLNKEH